MVEHWNSSSGTVWWNSVVEQCWWNSVVEQWNSVCNSVVERWNSDGGIVLVEQ